MHFILLKKNLYSELDWYESRALYWSYAGVNMKKLKSRSVPQYVFRSVIFWRESSETKYAEINKKITLASPVELFVIHSYRN